MKETFVYTVQNPVGLYADAVDRMISVAGRFDSKMTITYRDRTVNLKSMMGVLSLGIPTKAVLTITAEGQDAVQACETLRKHMEQTSI